MRDLFGHYCYLHLIPGGSFRPFLIALFMIILNLFLKHCDQGHDL
jgi:hypothetical protein